MKNGKENTLQLLDSVKLTNLLSFGNEFRNLSLSKLNVLIGTNGSGKSNFIDAVELLRATSADLQKVISRGGGVEEWMWKGSDNEFIFLSFTVFQRDANILIDYQLALREDNLRIAIKSEVISIRDGSFYGLKNQEVPIYWNHDSASKTGNIRYVINNKGNYNMSSSMKTSVERDSSVLSQIRDPEKYPQLAFLTDSYKQIRIYREWSFGRNTIFRQPQRADMRNDWLEEDFSNLGLFISKLRRNPKSKKAILNGLNSLYSGITDFDVIVEGGTVQIFFHEGDFSIPATRLSDGTLRYLALLAILNDPTPPPLICIEEPELGLHPDVLPKLADLLKEASTRTQLIVTTHSDILIDALSDTPESVVVCEKHNGQTIMKRLEADHLKDWLSEYRLGNLWLRGELGGTRW